MKVAARAGWVRPTSRLTMSPAALLALAASVVPVVLLRLIVESSADPPAAVGTAVAVALAAATAAMLADDAAVTLAPIAMSPGRRALHRALIASVVLAASLLTLTAISARAWPGGGAIDIGACVALAVTAGVVTTLTRSAGSKDAAGAALAGTITALALAVAPMVVGGLGPLGRWLEDVTSFWSTNPVWCTLAMLAITAAVLRRR